MSDDLPVLRELAKGEGPSARAVAFALGWWNRGGALDKPRVRHVMDRLRRRGLVRLVKSDGDCRWQLTKAGRSENVTGV
jgi:hypothetical protein